MDDGRFEERFRVLYPRVCRFLGAQLGGSGRAEEVAQEAFLRLYRDAPPGLSDDAARRWVFRVARNLALNEAARARRWGRISDELRHTTDVGAPALEEAADRRREMGRLRRLVAELPEAGRAALLLREQQGMSYREIAAVLRLSLSNVKVLIFRARSSLRRRGREEPRASGAR